MKSNRIHLPSPFLMSSNSVDPNGEFITDNKFFSAETCERPYFKRMLSRNKNKKMASKTPTEAPMPVSSDWTEKVQIVNLAKYLNEPILFNKIVNEVFALLAEGKIEPYISAKYPLGDVNKAIRFLQRKKCLGNVLVGTAELKAKRV